MNIKDFKSVTIQLNKNTQTRTAYLNMAFIAVMVSTPAVIILGKIFKLDMGTIIIIVAGMLFITYILTNIYIDKKTNTHEKEIKNHFLNYYNTLEPTFLSKLTNSPEVHPEDQKLITSYLNKNHPGWSL